MNTQQALEELIEKRAEQIAARKVKVILQRLVDALSAQAAPPGTVSLDPSVPPNQVEITNIAPEPPAGKPKRQRKKEQAKQGAPVVAGESPSGEDATAEDIEQIGQPAETGERIIAQRDLEERRRSRIGDTTVVHRKGGGGTVSRWGQTTGKLAARLQEG